MKTYLVPRTIYILNDYASNLFHITLVSGQLIRTQFLST